MAVNNSVNENTSKQNDVLTEKEGFIGPTFSLANRARRALWVLAWTVLARWTPPFAHKWRILVLNMFGAKISFGAYIYSDVRIWAPWNLEIELHGTLARHVTCYNIARVRIGEKCVVSQGAHLCTGTHDYRKASFPLTSAPIVLDPYVWVCADAFVGPGVHIHEGAILGAAGSAFKDLQPWTIYIGNPAVPVKTRNRPIV